MGGTALVGGWVGPWVTSAPALPTSFSLLQPLPSQEGSLAMGVRDSGKVGQLLAGQQGVLRLTSLNW